MLYFDFDGTLVDVWQRYYRIFKDASRISGMTFEDYVRLKKELPQDGDLARCFGAALPADYREKKRSFLEDPRYLAYDRLLVPKEQIREFFRSHSCRILTSRRSPEAFFDQLQALGLEQLREKCVVLNPDEKKTKTQYLRENHPDEAVYLVGDAEAEAQASQLDNVRVYLVRTGLRNPETLPGAQKCVIIDHVSDFMNAFKESV